MATTPLSPDSSRHATRRQTVSIAVVAANQLASLRIGVALEKAGLVANRSAADVRDLVDERRAADPDAVVLACDSFDHSSLAAIRRIKSTFRRSHVVVVSSAADASTVRQALGGGADGLVADDDLEATLGHAVQSVLVGHLSVPRHLHRCVVKPSLSHREKQVLALIVRGLGNREIGSCLFLAESTVKCHLSAAYQKLGVRSRTEAAALVTDPHEGLRAILDVEIG
jgi:DNA-binding NarL/FixJ family response regulator